VLINFNGVDKIEAPTKTMSNRNNALRIEIVDSSEKFALLQQAWTNLLDEALDASIFMSWDWQYYWWKYYGNNQPLRLLLVFEEDGGLVGVLPLYINTIKLFKIFPVRIVKFVGVGGDTSPDYLGPVLKNCYSREIASALINYILNSLKGWDVIELIDMHDNSVFATAFSEICSARNIIFRRGISANISYINLPQSWKEYLNSLHRDRRFKIRYYRKKLEKNHNVKFFVIKDEKHIDFFIDNLIRLHHLRWKNRASEYAFSSQEYVGFHRDVIYSLAKKDCIRFYCIEIDDKAVAIKYCYKFRGGIFFFQFGFDPNFEKLGLGQVLLGYAIEHAILESNTIFDFLKGEYEYKKIWAKEITRTIYLRIYPKWNIFIALFFIRLEVNPKFKHFALKLRRIFWRPKDVISSKLKYTA